MFGYKCDKCGAPIHVDPFDERLCDDCLVEIKSQEVLPTGYIGIGREKGKYIPFDEAYTYALEHCLHGTPEEQEAFRAEFGQLIEEWYFSGNYFKEVKE